MSNPSNITPFSLPPTLEGNSHAAFNLEAAQHEYDNGRPLTENDRKHLLNATIVAPKNIFQLVETTKSLTFTLIGATGARSKLSLHVYCTHAWLEENQLTALAAPLQELGAESVSNLRTLDAQDIKALETKLKKLERRRFREAWKALCRLVI